MFFAMFCSVGQHRLFEMSLSASHKWTIILSRLNCQGLFADDMAKYNNPVSKLFFLLKMVEKIVLTQLICCLEANSLLPKQQSGFRKFHSTESVLTQINIDLLGVVDWVR